MYMYEIYNYVIVIWCVRFIYVIKQKIKKKKNQYSMAYGLKASSSNPLRYILL